MNFPLRRWLRPRRPAPVRAPFAVRMGDELLLVTLRVHSRARRYVLRLDANGMARVTMPRGGSEAAAREFVTRHVDWLRRQREKWAARPRTPRAWETGTEILFRGETVRLVAVTGAATEPFVQFADQLVPMSDPAADLRSVVERHLQTLAGAELPGRVLHFAQVHGLNVRRVAVRNQKSRWGSCSQRGTVSLNWRLIQAPPVVADYVILHELMHLRQMNHSRRFWQEVASVCPDYRTAERWLKAHARLLR